jgi:CDGSH-type Zn-finger protein
VSGSPARRAGDISRRGIVTEAVVARGGPCGNELEAGKTYYWCACGRSANQPFCDGSHKAVGMAPKPVVAEKSATAYLCGCKQSKNAPYCDGTHKSL